MDYKQSEGGCGKYGIKLFSFVKCLPLKVSKDYDATIGSLFIYVYVLIGGNTAHF